MARIALAGTRATHEHIGVFDEQPVIMAALSDPDVMRHIRQSVFGGLDSMPADERAVLLDTLETWLDAGGSSEAAAATLFCHPNTVRHRLRRLEAATGRRLRTPRDIADLCLALAAERALLTLTVLRFATTRATWPSDSPGVCENRVVRLLPPHARSGSTSLIATTTSQPCIRAHRSNLYADTASLAMREKGAPPT